MNHPAASYKLTQLMLLIHKRSKCTHTGSVLLTVHHTEVLHTIYKDYHQQGWSVALTEYEKTYPVVTRSPDQPNAHTTNASNRNTQQMIAVCTSVQYYYISAICKTLKSYPSGNNKKSHIQLNIILQLSH